MKMGIETEFGILGGWSLDKARAVYARALELPHIPSGLSFGGVFLANGARVYIDQESQNEYATPETEDPADLVARDLAGRRLMEELAAKDGHTLVCTHFDYGAKTTWGSHENYECRSALASRQMESLLPHLVSRILYAGAGGIDPGFAGVRPIFSPRASAMETDSSRQGVLLKALVYEKPDAYGSMHRLHITCGESLLSHRASYLRLATTAMVARLLAGGETVGPGPFAKPAVEELRRMNLDIGLEETYRMRSGEELTALGIQARFMKDVADRLDRLPPWASLAVRRWSTMLFRLSGIPDEARQWSDAHLFADCLWQLAGEYGLSREEVETLNSLVEREAGSSEPDSGPRSLLAGLRAAACELYIRLHAMSDYPLHEILRDGSHRLMEIDDGRIAAAINKPPEGRAAARAAFIAKNSQVKEKYVIGWDRVLRREDERLVILPEHASDDWAESAFPPISRASAPGGPAKVCNSWKRVHQAFRMGAYRKALDHLPEGPDRLFRDNNDTEALVLSHARLGDQAGALHQMNSGWHRPRLPYAEILRLFCGLHRGLAPGGEVLLPLVEDAERAIAARDPGGHHLYVFEQCKACALIRSGKIDEAADLLTRILGRENPSGRPRMYSRTECYLADALRLRGDIETAMEIAGRVLRRMQKHHLVGDIAEQWTLLMVKLDDEPVARDRLLLAERVLERLKNPLGLARVVAMHSLRLCEDESQNARLRDMFKNSVAAAPVLAECPITSRILGDWEAWRRRPGGRETSDFSGL